jgi:hypothetical protein
MLLYHVPSPGSKIKIAILAELSLIHLDTVLFGENGNISCFHVKKRSEI